MVLELRCMKENLLSIEWRPSKSDISTAYNNKFISWISINCVRMRFSVECKHSHFCTPSLRSLYYQAEGKMKPPLAIEKGHIDLRLGWSLHGASTKLEAGRQKKVCLATPALVYHRLLVWLWHNPASCQQQGNKKSWGILKQDCSVKVKIKIVQSVVVLECWLRCEKDVFWQTAGTGLWLARYCFELKTPGSRK